MVVAILNCHGAHGVRSWFHEDWMVETCATKSNPGPTCTVDTSYGAGAPRIMLNLVPILTHWDAYRRTDLHRIHTMNLVQRNLMQLPSSRRCRISLSLGITTAMSKSEDHTSCHCQQNTTCKRKQVTVETGHCRTCGQTTVQRRG